MKEKEGYPVDVYGYWSGNPEDNCDRGCWVGEWDGIEDRHDEEIFYYFKPDEEILGDHGDFTVVGYDVGGCPKTKWHCRKKEKCRCFEKK